MHRIRIVPDCRSQVLRKSTDAMSCTLGESRKFIISKIIKPEKIFFIILCLCSCTCQALPFLPDKDTNSITGIKHLFLSDMGKDTFADVIILVRIILMITILMISLFHILIWLCRPRERSHIYLAFIGLLIFLRMLTDDNFPGKLVSLFETGTGLDYLSLAIGWVLFIAFLDSFFPLFVNKTISHFFQYIGILAGIFFFSAGVSIYPRLHYEYLAISVLLAGYSCFVIIRSIRKQYMEGIPLLAGFIILCLSLVIDILPSDILLYDISMMYPGLITFLLIPIIIRHIKWAKDLNTAEYMAENLNLAVAERTGELEKAKEETEAECMRKIVFFINIAHEIKTPLTLIRNSLEEYLKKYKLTPELKTLRFYTGKLFRDMLNLLDSEKAGQDFMLYNHHFVINATTILLRIIDMFTPLAREKRIRLLFSGEDAVFIAINPDAFDRIINNLLDNAIKYTDENGCIDVFLKSDRDKAFITVKDNGRGIPGDHLERIFLPYYRITGEKGDLRGFGIGLSLVKQIVDSCNGEIRIKSKIGKGTMITIVLSGAPVRKKKLSHSTLAETGFVMIDDFTPARPPDEDSGIVLLEETYDKKKYTVFIVDDHIDLIGYLQRSMMNHFNVFYATDGKSALEKLNSIPKPDIIVSDIMMEIMDGHEFYDLCMANISLRDIPFIFLTAKTSRCEKLESLKKGIIDYIFKPFDVEELIEKIISIIKNIRTNNDNQVRKIEDKISEWLHVQSDNEFIHFEKKCKQLKISRREKEIIRELLKGYETKEIAYKLSLSVHTVRNHVRHIYKKCKVQNRVELVNLFSRD